MKTQTQETTNGVFPHGLPADLMAAESVLAQLSSVFFPAEVLTRSLSREFFEKREDGNYGDDEWPDVAARYRILVEQIPAVVFMAFLDQGIGEAYVSPQIEAVLGFTQEEWLNDPVRWYQQIHPEDKARWSVEAAQMFLTGEPLRSVYRVLARDGHTVWFHCEVRMVRRADGRPWFIHGVGFDITELKRAEEALRASEQMLHGLFEFAPDTVVVVNHCGRMARVNAQVERMFGYKRDELLDQPVEVLLPERFRKRHLGYRASYVAEPHTRPMGAGLELYGRRKDGREFPVDIMLSPMKTAEGGMVIAVIRDITMRKQAAEALKRREEELRALTASLLSAQDEERRRIARELHDGTAQNLAGLAMNLSLLLNLPAATSGSPLFGVLSDSLALTEQCSREVRNLSYLLHPPLLDDLGLASALRSFIAGFIHRTGIHVELEMPPELGRLGVEVETALFRIVQEGLANVHRHSGSPRAAIRISLTATEVRLELKDEGVGYVAGANEENGVGAAPLGVGIPGMRERARQLGGEMEIYLSGNGTTVTVTLPLRSQV
jgi:PAS domain S-box-containing protein